MNCKLVLLIFFLLPLTADSQYKVSIVEVDATITSMTNGNSGQIVYGDETGAIGEFDGLLLTELQKINSRINLIHEDGQGLMVCAGNGLFHFDHRLQKLSGSHLDVLAINTDKHLLFATKGIFQKQGSSYEPLAPVGLPEVSKIDEAKLMQTSDADYLYLDSEVYRYTNRWKLLADSVIDIAITNDHLITLRSSGIYQGSLPLYEGEIDTSAKVLSTSNGRIFITNQNYISEVIASDIRPIYSINSQEVSTLHEDSWGNIWVTSPGYMYRIVLEGGISLPVISLTEVNGQSPVEEIILEDGLPLQASWNGYHLGVPRALRFQYRVLGYSDWSVPSRTKTITIEDLTEGNYDLEVRATIDGVNYAYISPVKVRVGGTLITRIWWVAMLVALAIVSTAAIGMIRFKNYTSKIETDRAKLQAENRLLTLEQKALQLQMNPHFIFNALNSVKGQIAKGDNKEARASLTAFAQLMRLTLDQSRTETATIESEVEYLQRYLSLEQWVNQNEFAYEIKVTEVVAADQLIPTMLIQPFVENAIKHAFQGLDRKGHLVVLIDEDLGALQITVSDNGIGIQKGHSPVGHKSIATTVVKERLALKYPAAKQKLLQIGGGDGGIGTKVKITIPR